MHQPVMTCEVLRYLDLKPGYTVLDATVGMGGHASLMLKLITPGGRLIGVDSDADAIRIAGNNLSAYKDSFVLIKDNFRNMTKRLSDEGIKSLDAALFDLGVSSYQLDEEGRGFAIKKDAPLDMRMDRDAGLSAYDIINRFREEDISDIIKKFGEERYHKKIARDIARKRSVRAIETTGELADIVRCAIGRARSGRIDSATRTFQAIRIVVNDELGAIEGGLKEAVSLLRPGAKIAVISFHSLEDRIAKNLFKGYASLGIVKILTRKPIMATDEEAAVNPRSRSAKLRVAERMP